MIEGLKPYVEYKKSGQKWLGGIPSHWELRPGHAAFAKRKEPNLGMKEKTVLSLSYGRIKVKAIDKQHGLVPESYETYQVVNEGNVIIRGTDLQNDRTSLRIGLSRHRGIISSAYLCLEAQPSIAPEYGYQILNVFDLTKAIYRYGSGLRQNLDHGEIKRLPIFLPPLDEQAAIVRFLDHANRKIDGFIRAKRKLIGLLNEQKQAIIHRAVTRGLDPNTPLKPSGIPWLGDIPGTWTIMRLKSLVTDSVAGPYGSSLTKAMYVHEGYRVYGQQQVIPDDFKRGDYYITPEKFALMRRYQVYPDDVLVSVMGTVGRVGVVPEDAEPGIINPRLVRYRPDFARVRSRYLQLTMQAPASRDQLLEGSKGTTMDGLNMGILGRLQLVIPPLEEQDEILFFVRNETAAINTAIARTEREIALMQEYRTRLTADIVTGKLDVREAAAKLPDLPTDLAAEPAIDEALDETDILDEIDPEDS